MKIKEVFCNKLNRIAIEVRRLETKKVFHNKLNGPLLKKVLYNYLVFYINKATKVRYLYIFKTIIKNILDIIYIIKKYLEFTYYFKRVLSS